MAMTVGTRFARTGLLAALFALAAEGILTSGVLLDTQLRVGAIPAAVAALGTYVLPGVVVGVLVLATRRGSPLGRTVLLAVGALVVARLALQLLEGTPRYVVGLATVAITVAALLLAVVLTAGQDGAATAISLTLGLGLHAALGALTGTWGAVWRGDLVAWTLTLGLLVLAAWSAWRLRDQDAGPLPRGTWVLGPFLGLGVLVLANPAFLASQAQVGPHVPPMAGVAGAAIVTVTLLTVLVLERRPTVPRWLGLAFPLLLGLGFFLPDRTGSILPVALVLLAAVPAAALLLAATFDRAPRPASRLRLAGLGVGVGLGAILPLLVYQLDYDIPLGFPNALVPVAAAALLAVGSRAWRRPAGPRDAAHPRATRPRRADLALAGLALVVLAFAGTWPAMPFLAAQKRTPGTEVTVVSWNVHYGVGPDVSVDLEALARAIAAEDPDVVTLQEVPRGWLLGGGADVATWLSHRLGMGVVFAPAADRQFGNALLSRYVLDDVAVTPLPYGEGPQRRSAISATLTLADGTPVRVSSVHLQHRDANTATRLEQLATLTTEVAPTGPALLAGDLNARPGWPEIDVLTDVGWVSALDTAGDPAALTFPAWDPQVRIDWVFGHALEITRADVLSDEVSDHLGVVVTAVPVP